MVLIMICVCVYVHLSLLKNCFQVPRAFSYEFSRTAHVFFSHPSCRRVAVVVALRSLLLVFVLWFSTVRVHHIVCVSLDVHPSFFFVVGRSCLHSRARVGLSIMASAGSSCGLGFDADFDTAAVASEDEESWAVALASPPGACASPPSDAGGAGGDVVAWARSTIPKMQPCEVGAFKVLFWVRGQVGLEECCILGYMVLYGMHGGGGWGSVKYCNVFLCECVCVCVCVCV
jgi:hypothetical protein